HSSVRLYLIFIVAFFFFFQAEDGIRDSSVTGVQTCALPISLFEHASLPATATMQFIGDPKAYAPYDRERNANTLLSLLTLDAPRSEERRVGKECRSRWTPYQIKNKVDEKKINVTSTHQSV